MRSGLPSYTEAPELTESLDHDPTRVWSPGGGARHRLQGPVPVRSGHGIQLLQDQLCPARSHRRTCRRRAVGPSFSGSFVWTAWHEEHNAPRQHVEHDPRTVLTWLPVRQFLIRHVARYWSLTRVIAAQSTRLKIAVEDTLGHSSSRTPSLISNGPPAPAMSKRLLLFQTVVRGSHARRASTGSHGSSRC
jgi:hypothetical protein